MEQIRGVTTILSFAILIIIPLVILEGALYLAFQITGNPRWNTLYSRDHPKDPDNYIKIATFGGSAAAGYNSERGFETVLLHELSKRYSESKFYVKKYAQNGYPLYQQQAEILKYIILKYIIKDYDYFLIYAGNNEAMIYFDEVGFLRPKDSIDDKTFSQPPRSAHFQINIGWLDRHSRVYRVLYDVITVINQRIDYRMFVHKNNGPYRYPVPRHTPWHSDKEIYRKNWSMPITEIAKLPVNFKTSLEEIAALAEKHGKHVFVAGVMVNEARAPHFSVYRQDITDAEVAEFQKHYQSGRKFLKQEAFQEALAQFEQAIAIDEHVAVAHYYAGVACGKMGNIPMRLQYFRKSVDLDGIIFRSLSVYYSILREVSRNSPNVHYVDTIEDYYQYVLNGMEMDDFISDINHPNLLGHTYLGFKYLCAMTKREPFRSQAEPACLDWSDTDLFALEKQMRNELGVTRAEEAENLYMISRWHTSSASLTSTKEQFLDNGEKYIRLAFDKSQHTVADSLNLELMMAFVNGQRTRDAEQMLNDLNRSVDRYPNAPINMRTYDSLSNAGFFFNGDSFEIIFVPKTIF